MKMEVEITESYDLNREKVTITYLFLTFLKIGCLSFGGHMALISLVQRILVGQDKTIDNEAVLNSVAVGSFMPGPLAVNVVANIGYLLKGKWGAAVSMFAVLLPACILILCLAFIYFSTGSKIEWTAVMQFVGTAVGVIIFVTGVQMFKKDIALSSYYKIGLFLFAIILNLSWPNYVVTISLIAVGAIFGLLTKPNKNHSGKAPDNTRYNFKFRPNAFSFLIVSVLGLNQFLFISGLFKNYPNVLFKIATVFSGISISLFGGGYVIVPIMQSLFVRDIGWLTSNEFVDAIAFSQVTPGPILVSATFIGFKLAGIAGALVATACMFIPSAVLMIMVCKIFNKRKDHPAIKNMISGVKVVVIGLIISSAIKILLMQPKTLAVGLIFLISLALSFKYKLSPVYLIIGAIFLGTLTLFL